jgi:hypothetical protein
MSVDLMLLAAEKMVLMLAMTRSVSIRRDVSRPPSMSVDLMLPAAEKMVLVLEGIGDGKIRLNSSSLDHPLTIPADPWHRNRGD